MNIFDYNLYLFNLNGTIIENCKNIKPILGIEIFLNELFKRGKTVCVLTDSSTTNIEKIKKHLPLLNKVNFTTKDYLKTIQQFNFKNEEIICFEDSYKGWKSSEDIIYTSVLINNPDYVFYNKTNTTIKIENYLNIDDIIINYDIEHKPFYIASKSKYYGKWIELKEKYGFNITSTWIYFKIGSKGMQISEKELLCKKCYTDVVKADFIVMYSENNDETHCGALIEIGMAYALGKNVYSFGYDTLKDDVFTYFKNDNDDIKFSHINSYDIKKHIMLIQLKLNKGFQDFENKLNLLKQQK